MCKSTDKNFSMCIFKHTYKLQYNFQSFGQILVTFYFYHSFIYGSVFIFRI